MIDKGRTIREAIAIALEGLPGHVHEWANATGEERKAMRIHVIAWLQEYARIRGVILDPKLDIEPELDAVVAIARTKTPK